MTRPDEPTDAHIVLLAVQLTSDGDLDGLQRLVCHHREVLPETLLYRLLLSFYPVETPEQSLLIDFLKSLRQDSIYTVDSKDTKFDSSILDLTRADAVRQCRALRLQPIPHHTAEDNGNGLSSFIIEWVKRLDLLGGAVQPLAEFVEQFVEQDPKLQLWYEAYLVPVVRLQYEFYPEMEDVLGVQDLEALSGERAVSVLLQYAKRKHDPMDIARDLDYVVAPWVRGTSRAKRRKVDRSHKEMSMEETTWESVNDWLVAESLNDFDVAAKAFVEWKGPLEDLQSSNETLAHFAQTGMAIIYGCSRTTTDSLSICRDILGKAASVAQLAPPDLSTPEPEIVLPRDYGQEFDEMGLLSNSLTKRGNQFTQISDSSILLLVGLFATCNILLEWGLPSAIGDLARNCVFGLEMRHKDELRRLLRHIPRLTRKETNWRTLRRQVLWLRSWSSSQQTSLDHRQPAYLSRLSLKYVEVQMLEALLNAGQYDIVKEVYVDAHTLPLLESDVEGRIVAAIFEAYDNASNGNRDRGGMKRANEILRAFRPSFPQSPRFADIDCLIKATHSLSFYPLTLQHGVPFKPVAIRVQKDPLSLVEKVLEQDSKAYTKLDDLLEIGRNLIRAHLPSRGLSPQDSDPLELRVFDAEHRVTYLAIMAALAADDFHTAYAYITTRLSSSASQITSGFIDDTSWRAAFAAGKYRPSGSPGNLDAQIASLSQRMELLSRALMLAPSGEALPGILATWRRYEEEIEGLKAQAVEEERVFDAKADASLPGAFALEERDADVAETKRAMAHRSWPGPRTAPSYEEEAPLGLFDVARGAATALRRSTPFPLGAAGLRDLKISDPASASKGDFAEDTGSLHSLEGGRIRKRDVVTNMVTSGLVSGMGWVLGAQPRDRNDQSYQDETE